MDAGDGERGEREGGGEGLHDGYVGEKSPAEFWHKQ